MGVGMLLWLLFLLAIITGITFLLQALLTRETHRTKGRRSRALDVLNERFARGEIEREEFEERRSVLRSET